MTTPPSSVPSLLDIDEETPSATTERKKKGGKDKGSSFNSDDWTAPASVEVENTRNRDCVAWQEAREIGCVEVTDEEFNDEEYQNATADFTKFQYNSFCPKDDGVKRLANSTRPALNQLSKLNDKAITDPVENPRGARQHFGVTKEEKSIDSYQAGNAASYVPNSNLTMYGASNSATAKNVWEQNKMIANGNANLVMNCRPNPATINVVNVAPTATHVTLNHGEKYPQDCFSFIALNGPTLRKWSKQKALFFLFGLMPFCFQLTFTMLMIMSVVDEKRGTIKENDNPDTGRFAEFIPANTSSIVRATQIVSLSAYLLFPEASLQDVIKAFQFFPRSSEAQSGDPVKSMKFSCFLRGFQGFLAVTAALLLVLTSGTVVDIILDFTAVNFVSKLDDYAFVLAKSGQFGPALKVESEKIMNTKLPRCMCRKSKHICYMIVSSFIALILFGTMILIIVCQENSNMWITPTFRVQFQDIDLNTHNGCYQLNKTDQNFKRHTYNHFNHSSSIGYCRENRRWLLFEDSSNEFNPCDTSAEGVKIAHSSKTDAFDIEKSFGETWLSTSNTPLDLYFFDNNDGTEALHCDSFLGDGKCDQVFNQANYHFDGGDCCASTCISSRCGMDGLTSVFGNAGIHGDGFSQCIDPQFVTITIHLNSVLNSRRQEFVDFDEQMKIDCEWNSKCESIDENDWRNTVPVKPYFALDCNNKNILSVYIEELMAKKKEIVMVEDGSDCTLVVRNTTAIDQNIIFDDPIWFVNYSIFHETKINEQVEILTESSDQVESSNFKTVPECFFKKLQSHVEENSTLYSSSSKPFRLAVKWLMNDKSGNSLCKYENFLERYALININFAMNATFVSKARHCSWQSIICNTDTGKVYSIKLPRQSLQGSVPTEIGLFQNLAYLQACKETIERHTYDQLHNTVLQSITVYVLL